MLGLAVGIDYALFIVARHQDQVRAGVDPEESAARATGTAGSAVVFAGVTVLIALIGLSFAGIPFLTTMGIAAAVAVAIAVLVALTLTPAMLGFVEGPRRRAAGSVARRDGNARRTTEVGAAADAATHPGVRARPRAKRGFATRWVGLVTKHPVVTTVAVVLTLGIMAIPAASLALALPNAGMLPEENEARQSYDLVAEEFGPGFNGPLILTGTIVTSTDPARADGRPGRRRREPPGRRDGRARDAERDRRHGHRAARARRPRPTTRRRPTSCASCARSTTAGSTSTASTSRSPASPPSRSTSPTSSAPR